MSNPGLALALAVFAIGLALILRRNWRAAPPLLRVAALGFTVALLLMAAAVFWPAAAFAGDGEPLPEFITVYAPVTNVACLGPCCCGDVTVMYRYHWYGNPSYCRWFRPLRDGQQVRATLRLWR